MPAVIAAVIVILGLLAAAGVFSTPEMPRREEVKARMNKLGIR